jgi:FixJ family two-component response regulator
MSQVDPIVFVVDDDSSVRDALKNLFRSVGLKVETYATAEEFLSSDTSSTPGCLVLDVRLPGLSGLDVQRKLAEANSRTSIVFITAHGDVPMSVRAIKAGAVEFLPKPFRDQELLDAVRQCIDRDLLARRNRAAQSEIRERHQSLTAREQEVMGLVVKGLTNKQIAGKMGITEPTVKLHRGRVMHKMKAGSLADLIRMAENLNVVRNTENGD